MASPWTYIGRIWTNGEPFLAVDATLRQCWRGGSDEASFNSVCGLSPEVTSVPVGTGRAWYIGTDGVVDDEGWLEVFSSGHALAVVQVRGARYGPLLDAALRFSENDDQIGDLADLADGRLALFSAAFDGTGPDATEFVPGTPGPMPGEPALPPEYLAPGLLVDLAPGRYQLTVRWFTEFADDGCFARWILRRITAGAG